MNITYISTLTWEWNSGNNLRGLKWSLECFYQFSKKEMITWMKAGLKAICHCHNPYVFSLGGVKSEEKDKVLSLSIWFVSLHCSHFSSAQQLKQGSKLPPPGLLDRLSHFFCESDSLLRLLSASLNCSPPLCNRDSVQPFRYKYLPIWALWLGFLFIGSC